MPNHWLVAAICAFWFLMMALLLERDILPQWQMHSGPDFRAIAEAALDSGPVRWAVLQGEDRIGTAETSWVRHPDGSAEFRGDLDLRNLTTSPTLVEMAGDGRLRWQSVCQVSSDGNLELLNIQVYWGDSKPAMTVHGKVNGDIMKVVFRSGAFSHEEEFYYEPHSLVMSALAPIDKLPNLSLGQKWQHHVMNPIPMLGKTDIVRCEVTGEQVITWRGEPVPTYVVEQTYGHIRASCWVAHDGTVLRQEVPIGALVLEHE